MTKPGSSAAGKRSRLSPRSLSIINPSKQTRDQRSSINTPCLPSPVVPISSCHLFVCSSIFNSLQDGIGPLVSLQSLSQGLPSIEFPIQISVNLFHCWLKASNTLQVRNLLTIQFTQPHIWRKLYLQCTQIYPEEP